ncbi:MAG: GNAT family N-acetyltransferase [Actinobacteria bacterium]|nr:GNAT family N-acetyltransferase [Actinomycetota bacterium]
MQLEIRSLALDDAPAVAALIAARDAADLDQHDPDFTAEELRDWWASRRQGLNGGAWIALDGDSAVGFAKLHVEGDCAELEDDSCVHPDWRGRGIGTRLIEELEQWAVRNGSARVRAGVLNDDGRALLEGRGYELVRHFWRMEIDHTAEPAPPATVEGVELRPYLPGVDDRALHTAVQEAFEDHWNQTPEPFEDWLRRRTTRGDHDPALWLLGEAEGQIAGAALAFGSRNFGWVLDLGVRRPWRSRGLGHALLVGVFGELYRRGFTRVGLEVDAASETGATRLYERAGMRVTRQYDWYERRLCSQSSASCSRKKRAT